MKKHLYTLSAILLIVSKFTHMKDTFIATESHNMHTNKQIAMMLPYLVAP